MIVYHYRETPSGRLGYSTIEVAPGVIGADMMLEPYHPGLWRVHRRHGGGRLRSIAARRMPFRDAEKMLHELGKAYLREEVPD